MDIPLQHLNSSSRHHYPRESLDAETAAILSYALGNHVEDNDSLLSDDMDSISTHHQERNSTEEGEDETFLKEHDPLTSDDYEPFPQKKVIPSPHKFPFLICRNREAFEYVCLL
jgi:hypothetical protein